MFNTQSRANLSDFSDLFDDVKQDCAFYTVGKIPTFATHKLVPINSAKYLPELMNNIDDIAGVICTPEIADQCPTHIGCAISSTPLATAYAVHNRLVNTPNYFIEAFDSKIAPSARIHPRAYVAPRNVIIGDNFTIHANAVIHENTSIGDDCVVGSGTIIGTDAYETTKINGNPALIAQTGGVRIGRGVIFLSGIMVARSCFPVMTEIGDYCSFDNLVHIAHDCRLGKNVEMTACSMLCGRVILGNDVYIGPNATISNGLTLGDGAFVTIGSVVINDVAAGGRVTGNFAIEHKRYMRTFRTAQSEE